MTSLNLLLNALAEQTYPARRFECVIIDNGGGLGGESNVFVDRAYAFGVRVLREDRRGSYAVRNRGLQEARGEVLAFTDADCLPRVDWLTSAVARLQTADGPAMIGGRVEVVRAAEHPASAFQWYSILNDVNQARFLSQFHFAATANMVTSRETFKRVGDFNPALFSGGDLEWGATCLARGIDQIYSPDAVVHHPARATWTALVAKARRITGGHYQLNSRSRSPFLKTLVLTLGIAWASLRRTCFDPRLPTLGCRVQVVIIDLILRLVQSCELVRLRLGGRPRNC